MLATHFLMLATLIVHAGGVKIHHEHHEPFADQDLTSDSHAHCVIFTTSPIWTINMTVLTQWHNQMGWAQSDGMFHHPAMAMTNCTGTIRVDDVVAVHGLINKPHYNGRRGTVTKLIASNPDPKCEIMLLQEGPHEEKALVIKMNCLHVVAEQHELSACDRDALSTDSAIKPMAWESLQARAAFEQHWVQLEKIHWDRRGGNHANPFCYFSWTPILAMLGVFGPGDLKYRWKIICFMFSRPGIIKFR